MMTPLENEQRSQGGRNRAKNQDPAERRFQAILAASRRPLLHDVKVTYDELLRDFVELTRSRHWFRVFIVASDRSVIPAHMLSKDSAIRKIQDGGGAIGFLGVTMHGTSLQSFYKPLRRGVKVVEDLDRVSREVTAEVLEQLGVTELPPRKG
jgi:hypothetical protein